MVQRALDAATNQLCTKRRSRRRPGSLSEEFTPAQRRADALGLLAEAALTSDFDRGSAGDRYQVVLHVEAQTTVAAGEILGVVAGDGLSGTLEVDHGAVDVSAETSRRLSYDEAAVPMRHGADGAVLNMVARPAPCPPASVGPSWRATPLPIPGLYRPALRRASRAALDRRRCHKPRQPGPAVPAPSPRGPQRRNRIAAAQRGDHGVPSPPMGRCSRPLRHRRCIFVRLEPNSPASQEIPVWDGTPFDVGYAIDVLYRPSVAALANRS